MPISGILVRLRAECSEQTARTSFAHLSHLTLGPHQFGALAGVVDAPDYPVHDGVMRELNESPLVSSVDLVFHDFSDVTDFPALPKKQRSAR